MLAVNYSTLRENLKHYCDKATEDCDTIVVTRKNSGNIIMMAEAEYNNLIENLYVRSSAEYYNKLLRSIEELKEGKTRKVELIDE